MMNEIHNTIMQLFTLLGCFGGIVMLIAFLSLRALGRSVRDGCQKAGGGREVAKKIAARGLLEIIKRLIFKRR
jgi:hypothetical protein